MRDAEQFLKACAARYDEEISPDYFIYYAFQYEFCRKAENSRQFVVVKESRAHSDEAARDDHRENFPAALRTMCTWYGENYPAFRDAQPLTYARYYYYLPAALSFVHEARALWEKLHDAPPPVYDAQHDFWRELLAVVRSECQHQHLLVAWLHWRYGTRQAPPVAPENLPPNPFVERSTFGARRSGDRREGRTRPESRARREGTERRARGRGTERMPRRAVAPRRDDRPREQGRIAANRRFTGRGGSDNRAAAELTAAMTREIETAITVLQGDNNHPGVTLKPANSYYRRLQHKMVANLGFASISVGVDHESRAVKIVREA